MEIGKTFTPKSRAQWRAWLKKNHLRAKDIWLVHFNKASGKYSLPYNDAVEEAVAFGWIDSVVKKIDEHRRAQRYTPRRAKSPISPLNKERLLRMRRKGLAAPAGLATLKIPHWKFHIPDDVAAALKAEPRAWSYFQRLPLWYQKIRIGWIAATKRPVTRAQRLAYFIKMTALNKRFGMVQ